MPIEWPEHAVNSNGGTEMMGRALEARLPRELMDEVQIFPSRVTAELDPTKVRVLWLHDMPDDPMNDHLANEGWRNFHKLVFVSNWQMQGFINRYRIPWSRCAVIKNAIEPRRESARKWESGPVRLIYTPTPHRGLNVLFGAFQKLAEEHEVELDVYSSFKLYGWEDQDRNFQALFDAMAGHPNINLRGTQPNDVVRVGLEHAHIFAYPSTWPETSCLCLMEAMSSGLLCVHSNLGALSETAANWTYMYQYQDDLNQHAAVFYEVLRQAVERVKAGDVPQVGQKAYADLFYNWGFRSQEWSGLLLSLLGEDRSLPRDEFVYRVG